jgi:hypothetical protein
MSGRLCAPSSHAGWSRLCSRAHSETSRRRDPRPAGREHTRSDLSRQRASGGGGLALGGLGPRLPARPVKLLGELRKLIRALLLQVFYSIPMACRACAWEAPSGC